MILAVVADMGVRRCSVIVVDDDAIQHSVACWSLIFMVVLLVDLSWSNANETSLLSTSVIPEVCVLTRAGSE